jgi:hypothetical protein
MEQIDRAAALKLIAERPEDYPVIRDLPDDIRAALEPEERLRRYATVLAVLLAEAERLAFRSHERAQSFHELRAIFHAAKEAGQKIEAARCEAEEALERSRGVNAELRDRNEVLTLEVPVLQEAIRTMQEEIDSRECERSGRCA